MRSAPSDVQPPRYPSVHGREPRGLEVVPRSPFYKGRFGRIFRKLPPHDASDQSLLDLAATMFEGESGNNENIPAGYTYLGQFIDHDITFDPISSLQRRNDPDALINFRTPRFDLDSLYGRGPQDQPYLYQEDGVRLLIGRIQDDEEDCPRNIPPLPQGTDPVQVRRSRRALIGDPRNDENIIVNQLHLALLKFHNAAVDELEGSVPDEELFDRASEAVRWHYQWVVINDFLRRTVGDCVVDDILGESEEHRERYKVHAPQAGSEPCVEATRRKIRLRLYGWENNPYMPVEFSVAAYRFGHSQVRPGYFLNNQTPEIPIFKDQGGGFDEFGDLRGFRERPRFWQLAWERFFPFSEGDAAKLQLSRLIDPKLAGGLSTLPFAPELSSLAARNLLRGKALALPSGQDVAWAMGIPEEFVLRGVNLGLEGELQETFGEHTPLWFYILREALVHADAKQLGPVGGRIVAEVFIGLLVGDPNSYHHSVGFWKPEQGRLGAPADGVYTMSDLLRFAGVRIVGT